MKPIVLLILVFGLVLAGCALSAAQRQQAAFRQAEAVSHECHQKRLSGRLTGYTASVQCSNDRIRQVIAESGYLHMDLINLHLAYRLALAERMDRGEISEADGRLLEAEVITRIGSEEQRRNAAADQTTLYARQNWQHSLHTLDENLLRQQDRDALPAPRQPAPITCRQFRISIRCY